MEEKEEKSSYEKCCILNFGKEIFFFNIKWLYLIMVLEEYIEYMESYIL